MQFHSSHRIKAAGLQGKEYQPPPDPPFLHAIRSNIKDRHHAANIGKAAAEDHELTDDEGRFHYVGVIGEEAEEALAQTKDGHQKARANNENAAEDARLQGEAAQKRIEQINADDAKDAEFEASLGHLKGLGPIGYWFVAILAYVATFPLDAAAATGVPLPPGVQLILAATLGLVIILAAHFAADKALELDEARHDRAGRPGEYNKIRNEYIAALAAPILTIIAIAVWRGQTFSAQAEAVGGLFTSSAATNIAFACLSIAAFLAAFFAAKSYLRVKPLRDIRKKRMRTAAMREEQMVIVEVSARVQAQAQLNVQHLLEHEEKTIARIEATGEKRKKLLCHSAGVREHKHHKKLVNQGLRPPGATSSRNGHGEA